MPSYASFCKFIAASAVILFPASVLVMDNLHGLVYLIVVFLGIAHIFTNRKEVFPLTNEEKLFFFSLSFVMVTVIITTLVNDTNFARADRFLAPVLSISVYLFFKQYLKNEKYFWVGLVLGSIIAASTAVYQVFFGSNYRAAGTVNPIIFGDMALLMGAMSLIGIEWFKKQKHWLVLVPLVAFVCGILASALSLVRGGWIAIPFLVVLFIWYFWNRVKIKTILLGFSLLILMIGSIYLIPQTGVSRKIDTSITRTIEYFNSKNVNDRSRGTSIGSRLEMWRAAWIIFQESSIFGVGWGEYTKRVHNLIDLGVVNKSIARFYHPHNQFISALAKGGVLGFSAIVTLFLIPIVIFYRVINSTDRKEINLIAFAGLIFIVGFVCFSLTESILERSRSIIFFSFYLAATMALIHKRDLSVVNEYNSGSRLQKLQVKQ